MIKAIVICSYNRQQRTCVNTVLKRMQEWKEMPVDTAVLSLYHLQAYYWNEWQRGLAGVNLLTCDHNVLPILKQDWEC